MRILLTGFFFCSTFYAAQLSHQLSPTDVGKITEVLGFGGATRLMRSAEAYESYPGMKLGVESALVPGGDLAKLGDGSGSIPGLIPTPRLFFAKGLFQDVELILTFFSPTVWDTLSSTGAALKWTFYSEQSNYVSASTYFAFTHLTAFRSTYEGDDIEFGGYFSKDYVRLKPYFGAGLLFANGRVNQLFAPVQQTSWETTMHFFLGMEFEFPMNFTLQIDVMNTTPQGSVLVAKKF